MAGTWKLKDYIGVGIIIIPLLGIVYWVISNVINYNKQEEDLIRREFSGVLISIKGTDHGFSTIGIRQTGSTEELSYDIGISKFFRDHDIKLNDSISKEAGSSTLHFYKKENGVFEKCCAFGI